MSNPQGSPRSFRTNGREIRHDGNPQSLRKDTRSSDRTRPHDMIKSLGGFQDFAPQHGRFFVIKRNKLETIASEIPTDSLNQNRLGVLDSLGQFESFGFQPTKAAGNSSHWPTGDTLAPSVPLVDEIILLKPRA